MLPKKNRLTKKKDFDQVFRVGKSVKEGFLLCKIAKNNLADSRVGFVVSKKVSGKATQRNLVKRRFRAAAAKELHIFPVPVDVVVVALPGAEKKTFVEMQRDIKKIFNKFTN